MIPANLMSKEEYEIYEERAAICEYDGNMTRQEAEKIATKQIIDMRFKKRNDSNDRR
jgi:hypothetical protein